MKILTPTYDLTPTYELSHWPRVERRLTPRAVGLLLGALALCAVAWVLPLYGSNMGWPRFEYGEGGVTELSQDVVLILALWVAGSSAVRAQAPLLRWWLWAILAFLVLVFGEEISWGQHIIGWKTGTWFEAHNYQDETNFHNYSKEYTNDLPRQIIIGTALLVGGLYPLLLRALPRMRPVLPAWMTPPLAGVMPALFLVLPTLVARVPALNPLAFDNDAFQLSELAELYLYAFFLIYLVGLSRNARAARRAG